MMNEAYLAWLESQTGTLEQLKSYTGLVRALSVKEFVWFVPNDDNRLEDGLALRREFYHETGIEGDFGPCSVLEVIVALSRRLEFQMRGFPNVWAWQLIQNLELHRCSDPITRKKAIEIEERLEVLIWRTYQFDGYGGFFPLIDTDIDQRKIEIWYQMSCYVEEIHSEM